MKESQEQTKIIFDKSMIFKSLDKIGEYKNDKLTNILILFQNIWVSIYHSKM